MTDGEEVLVREVYLFLGWSDHFSIDACSSLIEFTFRINSVKNMGVSDTLLSINVCVNFSNFQEKERTTSQMLNGYQPLEIEQCPIHATRSRVPHNKSRLPNITIQDDS